MTANHSLGTTYPFSSDEWPEGVVFTFAVLCLALMNISYEQWAIVLRKWIMGNTTHMFRRVATVLAAARTTKLHNPKIRLLFRVPEFW